MTAPTDDQTLGLSRRHLLAGAGAAAGAAWAATVLPATAGAQAPAAVSQALVPQALLPQALAPAITGLQYHQIDGIAFTTLGNEGVSGPPGNYVFWQNITGAQPISPNTYINAPLDLPVGAVIRQVNALYQGQPIVAIRKRSFATGAVTDPLTPTSMTASPGGPFASSLNVANVPIEAGASYQLRFFCAAGVSIMGATLGFVPPPSAFVPFTGPKPRALDTRSGAPIGAGEVRTLDLTAYGAVGRAAVINVTATGMGGYGYLSVYSGDLASWPGNSSVNYTAAGQTIANGVIATLGAGNRIKIRAGETSVHAIVDVIGYLF